MIKIQILAVCLVLAFTVACTKQEEAAVLAATPAPVAAAEPEERPADEAVEAEERANEQDAEEKEKVTEEAAEEK